MQPLHRFVCLLAVAVLMTSWSPVCEGMNVRVKNGRLLVNGEPFFFLSTSGIVVSLDEMKRHHLNTVFSWSRKLMTDVADDATRLGFMLMPFVQSPGADQDAIRKMVVSFRDNQNLLAWNIGDDLNATHKDAVMQAVALVRKLDPKHRPIAFDAIRDECEMAPYADLFCTYYYPLLKREWSLRAYREFLERHARLREMRVKLKPSQAFWTWVQVHTQFWYTHRVHGGPERAHIASRFPDAEHIRLLTYEALAAGCKGIIYYSHRFLAPDWYGKDRYAEVGILGAELSIVGRLIADSERIHGARALARRVHAQALKGPFGLLIVLIVEGKDYQFQPAEGRIENVRVRVPVIPRGAKALLLGFPRPRQLHLSGAEFELPELELSGMVLITRDERLLHQVRAQFDALLPEVARFAIEVAEGKREKMLPAFEELRELDELPEGGDALWQKAAHWLDLAKTACDANKFAVAFKNARIATRLLRMLQRRAWRRAVGKRAPDWRDQRDDYRLCFYDIPRYFAWERALRQAKPGPNVLRNSSFEYGYNNWSDALVREDNTAGREITDARARTAHHSYHLWSKRPAIWHGREWDWVTMDARSLAIKVHEGEVYELSAWVYVPRSLRKTKRGAILGVVFVDEDGKQRLGGTPSNILECGRVKSTRKWMHLSLTVTVPKGIKAMMVRLGICGIGEAFFDDVEVRKLHLPSQARP